MHRADRRNHRRVVGDVEQPATVAPAAASARHALDPPRAGEDAGSRPPAGAGRSPRRCPPMRRSPKPFSSSIASFAAFGRSGHRCREIHGAGGIRRLSPHILECLPETSLPGAPSPNDKHRHVRPAHSRPVRARQNPARAAPPPRRQPDRLDRPDPARRHRRGRDRGVARAEGPQDGDGRRSPRGRRSRSSARSSASRRCRSGPASTSTSTIAASTTSPATTSSPKPPEPEHVLPLDRAPHLRGLQPLERQGRHAQLYRHPHQRELLGLGRPLHRRRLQPLRHPRRLPHHRRRRALRPRPRLRHGRAGAARASR